MPQNISASPSKPARFHLKRVFAKTETRRQSELVRLMLSFPG
jgi:DNA-binding CsgD family transcriptional regulator